MSQQTINVGTAANDGTGDPARTGGQKVNANFTEVYGALGATGSPLALPSALPVFKGGSGAVTLTGYVKGNGASAMTAVSAIPYSDVSGTPSNSVSNGFTGLTSVTAGQIPVGNGTSAFNTYAGLTFNGTTLATTAITSNAVAGSGSEVYGLGAVDNSNAGAASKNTILGAGAKVGNSASDCELNVVIGNGSSVGNFCFNNTVIGTGASSTNSNSVIIGQGNSGSANGIVVIGSGNSASAAGATALGFNIVTTHSGGVGLGAGGNSQRINELFFTSAFSGSAQDSSFRMQGCTGSFVQASMMQIENTWISSTAGSQKARVKFFAYDTAAREFLRADTNGSAVVTTVGGGGSVLLQNAALSTSATDGFAYIPTCAGAPTGTPTAQTGTVPMIYDTTNNNFYVYNGAWKKVGLV